MARPTARDLASSAVDLNGYAVLFKTWARQADREGTVGIPASRLVMAATFFEKVVDELLALIPPDEVDDASTK